MRRENAGGRLREIAPQILDHGLAIDGVGEGLPNAHIAQDRITQIERQIAERSSGCALDDEVRLLLESEHHVGSKRVAGDVGAAFAEFERAGGGIRHDHEANAGDARFIAPVVVVTFDDDFIILLGADEAKGAGADGMGRHFSQGAIGDDAHRAIG